MPLEKKLSVHGKHRVQPSHFPLFLAPITSAISTLSSRYFKNECIKKESSIDSDVEQEAINELDSDDENDEIIDI